MNLRFDTVIVRHGAEIGVKSSITRLRYYKLLMKSIVAKIKTEGLSIDGIDRRSGRIYIKTIMPERVAEALSKVFGISSTSPATSCKADLDSIADVAVKLAEMRGEKGVKFAVQCRRVGQHPFTSIDVCKYVGAKVLEARRSDEWRVDLKKPDYKIYVEIRDQDAFLYTDIVRGVGGLPQGSQKGLLCLLSSGIDSPVASWLVMKRGCTVTLIHFNLQPFSGEETLKKVVDLAKCLASWSPAYKVKLLMVPFGKILEEIVEKHPRKLTCILCKRMMLRISERIALKRGLMGIVTGDSIGEQASQTLENMAVISEAVKRLPIYRPLIGFDKPETEKIAREIGTYDISARPDEGCKASPPRPSISAKLDEVLEVERTLNVDELIEDAAHRVVELKV